MVIGINENDINQFGWPMNDNYLCNAITKLSKWGAASISLDLYRDVEVPPQNTCLREIINEFFGTCPWAQISSKKLFNFSIF